VAYASSDTRWKVEMISRNCFITCGILRRDSPLAHGPAQLSPEKLDTVVRPKTAKVAL
jgi:hypothetical protein